MRTRIGYEKSGSSSVKIRSQELLIHGQEMRKEKLILLPKNEGKDYTDIQKHTLYKHTYTSTELTSFPLLYVSSRSPRLCPRPITYYLPITFYILLFHHITCFSFGTKKFYCFRLCVMDQISSFITHNAVET